VTGQKPADRPAEKTKAEPPPPVLGDAGASGDPRVHQVLAELDIAVRNGAGEDELKVYAERLAALGVA
jgi:hypothetical protein